jgi:glycosyltransferase involved in cell wall biosynthesis
MTKNTNNSKKKIYPMVSVCTPTFNRRPFIQNMFQCFRNQDYPKHRIEWIIVDDGTDKIRDLIESSNIPQIRYISVTEKMNLGAKRNYMHSFARGSIIVYMDDDDYYPPDRISHAVERLEQNPIALCAGASEIYIYYKYINKMYQCGPYGPNHATAGTFAFRSDLLKITKYEESASLAEERAFLKDYTIPFVQLDPLKTILVFSHDHNTFDKRRMLDNPHPDYCKESPKTVETFIKFKKEDSVKKFFMQDIETLLSKYEPGLPKMKPDVLKQIKEIEEERKKMMEEEMKKQQANGPIVIQRPGEPPVQLSQQDVVNIIQQQQIRINELQKQLENSMKGGNKENPYITRVSELENMVSLLQKQLLEKMGA